MVCFWARKSTHKIDGIPDHQFIKDEAINILIAGRDTVGAASLQVSARC